VAEDGSVLGVERLGKGVDALGNSTEKAAGKAKQLDSSLSGLQPTLNSLEQALAGGAIVTAVTGIVTAAGAALRAGVSFNAEMQTSLLGISALASGLGEIKDEHGQILQGQERWNAALVIGRDLQKQAKLAALETKAEYKDIVQLLQMGLGPMLQNGISDTKKIIEMTKAVAQTGGALGLDGNMLGQEIKALMRGEKGPDNQIANALLSGVSKEKFDQLREAGKLYDFLMERMQAFAKAGEDSSQTFDVALSNTKDALHQALGEGTVALTETLASTLNDLAADFFVVDQNGHKAFDPALISAIKDVATAAGDAVERTASFLHLLKDVAAITTELNHPPTTSADLTRTVEQLAFLRKELSMGSFTPEEKAEREREIQQFAAMVEAQKKLLAPASDEGRSTAEKFFRQQTGGATLQGFPDVAQFGQQLLDMANTDAPKYLAMLREIRKASADGTLTQIEFAAALNRVNKEVSGPTLSGKKNPIELTAALKKQYAEYEIWVASVTRQGSEANDPFSKQLDAAAHQRDQALQKVKDAQEKFKGIARDWQSDTDAVNAAFAQSSSKIEKQRADFTQATNDWINGFSAKAIENPLDRAIAEIQAKQKASFDELKKKFEGGADLQPDQLLKGILSIDAAAARDIHTKTKELVLDPIAKLSHETQSAIEDDRISQIQNSIDRELAAKLKANDEWLEAEQRANANNDDVLKRLDAEKKKRDDLALAQAQRNRNKDIIGTKEWADEYRKALTANADSVAQYVSRMVTDQMIASRQAAGGAIENFLGDLVDHQGNAMKSLDDLGKSLGKSWEHIFASILTNGQSVSGQLKNLWTNTQQIGSQGGVSGAADAALAGAGIGSMVGGIFGGPNDNGALGGTIGGAIGAIIGSFTGNTALGAIIGSAIGTAVGASIKKGEDEIKVNIKDVVLSQIGQDGIVGGAMADVDWTRVLFGGGGGSIEVVEKGIDWTTRVDLLTQVQRKVKESMKGYQAILDLLPEEVQAQLAALKIKTTLSLTGGTNDAGDIRDENALSSLSDFLGEKLPKATFVAYKGAITAALGLMGVQSKEVEALFAYWGTLQGSELQDAVKKYVSVLVGGLNVQTLLGSPANMRNAAQASMEATALSKAADMRSDIAMVVASMPKLHDVEDVIAAQQRVNELSQQYYDTAMQNLIRINQLEQASKDSIGTLREQIQKTGMTDQEKIDYDYERMTSLRGQLIGATDPEQISRLMQQMQSYVSDALGIAPDNKENRDKLLGILDDVEKMGGDRYEVARQQQLDGVKTTNDLLTQSLEILKGIRVALTPPPPPTLPKPEVPIGGPGGGDGDPDLPGLQPHRPTGDATTEFVQSLYDGMRQGMLDAFDAEATRAASSKSDDAWQKSLADNIGRAVREAINGATFEGTTEQPILIDNGDLGAQLVASATRTVILTIKNNPDIINSRAK
jgi:hypothetical protein